MSKEIFDVLKTYYFVHQEKDEVKLLALNVVEFKNEGDQYKLGFGSTYVSYPSVSEVVKPMFFVLVKDLDPKTLKANGIYISKQKAEAHFINIKLKKLGEEIDREVNEIKGLTNSTLIETNDIVRIKTLVETWGFQKLR